MKPQFRLFFWLCLLTLVGYGGVTVVKTARPAADGPVRIAARYTGDTGYHLSPQHQDASFRYVPDVTEKKRIDFFATESDDTSNQVQLKKHHPAVFNYFADFYGAGDRYAHLFKTRLPQDARTFHPSVQRYIALRVIRI